MLESRERAIHDKKQRLRLTTLTTRAVCHDLRPSRFARKSVEWEQSVFVCFNVLHWTIGLCREEGVLSGSDHAHTEEMPLNNTDIPVN